MGQLKNLRNDIIFRGLFSLAFWFLWLVLPLINSIVDGDDKRLDYIITALPASLLGVLFFYFNAEFLAPKYLYKGKIGSYFASTAVLFVAHLISYVYLKDYLIDMHQVRFYDSRTLFPVLFVTGMSILYSLVVLVLNQTRNAQEEKAEQMKSELSFLRSQISPHFIFNILNSIVYLIRIKSEDAEKVTIELSKLMRYMLYESENKSVLLGKEIEYLENYTDLQRLRFGEDVQINLKIEGETAGLVIEPMLLIPFVENAFKHGVGFIKDPFIDINLSLSNQNTLIYTVKNKLNEKSDEPKDDNSGIGIRNVKRRLELLYPEHHKLKLSQDNGIFSVYLELTLKRLEK